MNGKQYAMILSFLCWLSVIVLNWIWTFNILEQNSDYVISSIVFAVMGFFFGSYAYEQKRS